MTDLIAAQVANALRLLGLDLFLFSLDHPGLPSCIGRHHPAKPCDGQRGKHPHPWAWSKDSTSDPLRLKREFSRGLRNTAVDCGRSRLLVVDEDAPGEFARAAAEMGETVPSTFSVTTRKGVHYWFRQPPELPYGNRPGRFRDYKIDIRGRGGYVVAPGSVHETGHLYQATDWDTPVLPVPAWLHTALTWTPPPVPSPTFRELPRSGPASRSGLAGVVRFIISAPPGTRNERLYWGSLRLWERVRDGQLNASAAEGMLTDAAAAIRLGSSESNATIASARKAILGA